MQIIGKDIVRFHAVYLPAILLALKLPLQRQILAHAHWTSSQKKMSKSDDDANGSIFLLDEPDAIVKKIKRAVTDSGTDIKFDETRPAINNLLTIYRLMTGKTPEECEADFEGQGYGHFKAGLADAVVEFLKPFQRRVEDYDDQELKKILKAGAEKAKATARRTLLEVYAKMGLDGASD